MKRLALLAITAIVAVSLSACGDRAEHKAENEAATTVEHQDHNAASGSDAMDATKTNQTTGQ
ncbi:MULTISPECIES: hypothetical protein [unclassified Legionella]|uniref:hypothetical protein n=1 Tax=unclassified Legionella TaxID=2622702 RepID=UPI00105587E2|nr:MULTISPECIES: hypothetical protein [unclassified Legionella]MDI9819146.1 hypothetical protein [Legionella sp. PL877]